MNATVGHQIQTRKPNYSFPCSDSFISLPLSRQLSSSIHLPGKELGSWRSLRLTYGLIQGRTRSANHTTSCALSSDDDYHYQGEEELPLSRVAYLDEQDIVTFLDPPKQLIPLDPSSYNPAAYLWKKIADIPEERRHRLLPLLKRSLISRAWEIAGTKYEDSNLAKKSASSLLTDGHDTKSMEFWNCRTNGGPIPVAWFNYFKKVVFLCKDGRAYGLFIGGSGLGGVSNSFPMYFMVKQLDEVMSTEQPCDLAYEFGDGILDLHGDDYPQGLPKPGKHPWPFNDQVVVYIRHVGPGVMVGQAWQEGEALDQVPKKLCGEILMVKDYASTNNHWAE